jgi:hypothetical protein
MLHSIENKSGGWSVSTLTQAPLSNVAMIAAHTPQLQDVSNLGVQAFLK